MLPTIYEEHQYGKEGLQILIAETKIVLHNDVTSQISAKSCSGNISAANSGRVHLT